MATYNKRGYKAPKPKEKEEENEIEAAKVENSTTAGVFNTLDRGASRAEDWVLKNQRFILGFIGVVVIATVSYMVYSSLILEPKEEEAANEMFQAQRYFQLGVEGHASDSLFSLALKGGEGKYGFLDIIEKYSGTDAANLAHYYAGISYFHMNKTKEAIEYLDKFKSKDLLLGAIAKGVIGDAFSQNNQLEEALEYYIKAVETNKNSLTTPRFLLKAGQTALALKQKEKALQYFTEIKNDYENAPEALNIDLLIGMAQ